MCDDLALRYLLIEPLTGVSTLRDGDALVIRATSDDEAAPALPYGYAHDEPLAGAFQVRPNIEGDQPLNARRWRSLDIGYELAADRPWRVRVRLRGVGWQAARTEMWQEIELSPGQGEATVDTADFVMCMDSGSADYIRFDLLEAPAGGELRIERLSPCEHDGQSLWAPRIDRFGQRKAGQWEGKVADEADLEADAAAALPQPLDKDPRDRWGGWTNGPKFEATGVFGVKQDDQQRWWLVTPEGHPYLSLGACCTGVGSVGVETFGRASWFEQLPDKTGDFAEAWRSDVAGAFAGAELMPRRWHTGRFEPDDPDVTVCNYLVANLIRSFGDGWYERWCDRTEARLDAWGMTSLGCWSDVEFAEGRQRPIVLPAERVSKPDWSDLLARQDAVWPVKAVPDAFDPRFEQMIEGSFEGLQRFAGKPWVLGFFVGNEQQWSFLVTPLAMPRHWHSRRVFIDGLKAKYPTIEALNEAWATGFASWRALEAEQVNAHPAGLSEQGEADCDAFLEKFCDRYFGAVRAELRRVVPEALFWGCRYLALPPRPAVLRGSTRHMDIVSVNWYLWHKQQPEDAAAFLGRWHELCSGKPLAMTEWAFEVTDERLLASRSLITTEQRRAELARRYIHACFSLPFVVGLHWFQWPDQPILGRSQRDGERTAFGIVDVADRPHRELVEAIRTSSQQMYPLHANG